MGKSGSFGKLLGQTGIGKTRQPSLQHVWSDLQERIVALENPARMNPEAFVHMHEHSPEMKASPVRLELSDSPKHEILESESKELESGDETESNVFPPVGKPRERM